ncbi:hypothetical protein T492DRAFT_1010836 [Pavlovales sp. CCMP2436]|nr:hypothetical protein T492DRAFT_1010836 [Pavlovales sp. CCMP2436]
MPHICTTLYRIRHFAIKTCPCVTLSPIPICYTVLAHMPLTEEIFKLITCDEYEDTPGVYYQHLNQSPKIMCDVPPHDGWRKISYLFICLYSLGIPLLGCLVLWSNRKSFDKPDFVATYGFLFEGFEQRVPDIFWEVTVVMGREVALVFLQTSLQNVTPLVQTLCAILFLLTMVIVQVWFKPYINITLDRLEALSLTTVFVTLYGGLFYYLDENDTRITGVVPTVTAILVAWHISVMVITIGVGLHLVLCQLARGGSVYIRRYADRAKERPPKRLMRFVTPLVLTFIGANQLPVDKRLKLAQLLAAPVAIGVPAQFDHRPSNGALLLAETSILTLAIAKFGAPKSTAVLPPRAGAAPIWPRVQTVLAKKALR